MENIPHVRERRPRQKLLPTLLKTAPLLICLGFFGLAYLVLSSFGVLRTAASETQPTDTQEARMAVSDTTVVTTEAASTPPETTLPATTEAVTTEEPTTAPATTEPPLGRCIYLTFDDGPGRNTEKVLDILDRYGVKATFFTVGYYVDRYPETAAMITQRGNCIACHTYTHEYDQCYASVDAFFEELEKWKTAVKNACGFVPERVCIRFPGGSKTPNAKNVSDDIKARLEREGYEWFDWNAADNDKYPKGNTKNLPDADYFWESYLETIGWYVNKPNAQVIFLTHDSENGTVEILPRMIEDLLERGYTFKTLDEHPDWND